jgi:pyruvate dehydrogenase E1 component alpha subunit
VIFIINNNQWAISVTRSVQCAAEKLSDKAIAAGIPGVQVDGNDAIAMYQAVQTGLQRAYQGKGPTLIEALSYRLSDHTTADDATRYRDNAQLKSAWEKEPIKRLRIFLSAQNLWNESEEKALQDTTEKQVQSAIDSYLNTPIQPVESMFDYLYAELPEQLIPQKDWATVRAMPGGSHYKEEQS